MLTKLANATIEQSIKIIAAREAEQQGNQRYRKTKRRAFNKAEKEKLRRSLTDGPI